MSSTFRPSLSLKGNQIRPDCDGAYNRAAPASAPRLARIPGWSKRELHGTMRLSERDDAGRAPLWNQKTVLRVCLRTCCIPVMVAEDLLNLVQSGDAFHARLPIPEHNKTLSAHAAMSLGVPNCAFAEHLHFDLNSAGTIPCTKVTIFRVSYW